MPIHQNMCPGELVDVGTAAVRGRRRGAPSATLLPNSDAQPASHLAHESNAAKPQDHGESWYATGVDFLGGHASMQRQFWDERYHNFVMPEAE
eukprot:8696738-Alexandrium_andersonii.AAC.1